MSKPEDQMFLLPNTDEDSEDEIYKPKKKSSNRQSYLLFSVILLSGTLNIFQAVWITIGGLTFSSNNQLYYPQEHVKLIDVPLYPKSVYELAENSSETDKLITAFNPDHGLVALPKGQPGILPSEPFPWDSSKEVYVLSGFHSLHSLQVIWQQLHELSGDKPLSSHLIHSINVLWEDVLCGANTTPMSISHKYISNRSAITEVGQTRQCRDWNYIEQFRIDHTACFKDLGAARKKKPMIEEWGFCPEDSPYKAIADAQFAQAGRKDN